MPCIRSLICFKLTNTFIRLHYASTQKYFYIRENNNKNEQVKLVNKMNDTAEGPR